MKYKYMENSRASKGLASFLCKHLAWWKNTLDCLLTVLMKDYLTVLPSAMLHSPSFSWSLQSVVYKMQTPVRKQKWHKKYKQDKEARNYDWEASGKNHAHWRIYTLPLLHAMMRARCVPSYRTHIISVHSLFRPFPKWDCSWKGETAIALHRTWTLEWECSHVEGHYKPPNDKCRVEFFFLITLQLDVTCSECSVFHSLTSWPAQALSKDT